MSNFLVKKISDRVLAHVDIDYFYAQCEEIRNPAVKNKPIVVCQYSNRTKDSGAVATTNYLARKYGVKSGISIIMAQNLLKNHDATFLPADHDYYEKISDSIMNILKSHSDKFEQVSIDEAFIDLTKKSESNFDFGKKLILNIKSKIFDEQNLTCSIGLAPNKSIAKIASDFNKPAGVTVIKNNEMLNFLNPLPVRKIYGVGKKTEKIFTDLGINTIADLSKSNLESLSKKLGSKKLAVYFHNVSNAIDDEPVIENQTKEQFSYIKTLKTNTRDIKEILTELYQLNHKIHYDLNKNQLSFKSISLIIIDENLRAYSKSKTSDHPLQNIKYIDSLCSDLLSEFLKIENKIYVRRVGIKVSNLIKTQGQTSLKKFF